MAFLIIAMNHHSKDKRRDMFGQIKLFAGLDLLSSFPQVRDSKICNIIDLAKPKSGAPV